MTQAQALGTEARGLKNAGERSLLASPPCRTNEIAANDVVQMRVVRYLVVQARNAEGFDTR